MFAARGIPVVIGAEHHASLLGPLGASFLSLDIWVAEEDAEEAAALLRDLREPSANAVSGDSANGAVADAGDADGEHADAGESAAPEAEDASGDSVRMQIERRRRTGLALLLGCFITFGTAHMSTRAWLRGIALAGLEVAGFRYVAAGDRLGPVLVIAAIIGDVVGAVWRIRTLSSTQLPVARVRRS